MLFNRLSSQLGRLFPFHKPSRVARQRAYSLARTESLESRVMLAIDTFVWDGGGTDNNWMTAENWVGDVIPDEGANLVFPDGASQMTNNNNFNAGTHFTAITIAAASYAIDGNGLVIDETLSTTFATGESTISLDIGLSELQATQIDLGSGGTLQLLGRLTGNDTVLEKMGAGTLLLGGSQSNTFDGMTTVLDGTLSLNKSSGLALNNQVTVGDSIDGGELLILGAPEQIANSVGITVNDGATFDLNGNSQSIDSLALQGGTVSIGFGVTLTVSSGLYTSASTSHTPSSVQGAGTLDLDGSANFTISVGDDGTLTNDLTIGAVIANGTITKTDNGTLVLSGANTYAGTTTVQQGTIIVEDNSALGTTGGSTTVSDGASLYFSGTGLSIDEDLTIAGEGYTYSGVLRTILGDATLTGQITLGATSRLMTDSAAILTVSGNISDYLNEYGLQVYTAHSGLVILSGDNDFDGAVDALAGHLRLTSNNALGTASTLATATIHDSASLELAGGITIPSKKSIVLQGVAGNGSDKLVNFSGNNEIKGSVTLEDRAHALSVGSGDTLTLSGPLYGSVDLDKNGLGTAIFSGDSSFTGQINVNQGTLQVDGDLSTASLIFVDGTLTGNGDTGPVSVSSAGILTPGDASGTGTLHTGDVSLPNDSTFTVGFSDADDGIDVGSLSVTGTVNLGTRNGLLVINMDAHPMIGDTFIIINNDGNDGIIGFFKDYPEGSQITVNDVSMIISYGGGTDQNDVTLTVVAPDFTWDGGDLDDSLWSSPDNWVGDVAPTSGANLIFPDGAARLTSVNDFDANTDFHTITVAAGYEISGNIIDLSGNIIGQMTEGSSALQLDVNLLANTVIDVGPGELELSGAISGSFGVMKTGVGNLIYSGQNANTYTGTTLVNDGKLVLSKDSNTIAINGDLTIGDNGGGESVQNLASGQLSIDSTVTVNEAATWDLGSFTEQLPDLIMQGATVMIGTNGMLLLSSSLTTLLPTNNFVAFSEIKGAGVLSFNGYGSFTASIADNLGTLVDARIETTIDDGGLIKTGDGVLALSGSNTYGGQISISQGAILAESNQALGTTHGTTTVSDGASLFFSGADITTNETLTVAGGGRFGGGVLRAVSGNATVAGNVTLQGNIKMGANDGAILTISGVMNELSGTSSITLNNRPTGRVVLSGSNAFDGSIEVLAGYLRVGSSNALGEASSDSMVTLDSGATLEILSGVALPAKKSITLNGLPVIGVDKLVLYSGNSSIAGSVFLASNNIGVNIPFDTDLTLSGAISGSVNLDKNGSGFLTITGETALTGQINVLDGTLFANGSLESSSLVFVDGMLRGNGTLPDVEISGIGTLSPGNSPGHFSTGDLHFSTGGYYAVELNGSVAGTSYDQTEVTGTVDLADANLYVDLGYSAAVGQIFTIISNDGDDAIEGTFNGLPEGSALVIGNTTLIVSYLGGGVDGHDGNDVTLTVSSVIATWDGEGETGNWTDPRNWVGDIAPSAGADLIFPAGALRAVNSNDFDAGTHFRSVTIEASSYAITGNRFVLDGQLSYAASGSSQLATQIELGADSVVQVSLGGALQLTNVLSGTHGLTKTGGGVLVMFGTSSNTYTGKTTVSGGYVSMNKSGAIAIPGDLELAEGTTVTYITDGQIADTSNVTLNGGTLNLNDKSDTIGSLTMTGGTAESGTGTLTIDSTGFIKTEASSVTSTISGNLSLTASISTFTVTQGTTSSGVDLEVSALISCIGVIIKSGSGKMLVPTANSFSANTNVSAGTLTLTNSTAAGTGDIAIIALGTLELSGGISLANPIFEQGVETAIASSDGHNVLSGKVSIFNHLIIDVSSESSLEISNTIDDDERTYNLEQHGNGVLILSGNNAYNGSTTVAAGGTLFANGSIASSSGVTVNGTLGGAGTVSNVTLSATGTLSPGNSPGIITTGNLSLTAGATYVAQIAGPTAGTGYDQTNVNGTVDLDAAVLSVSLDYEPAGDSFVLINNDGDDPVIGTFAGLPEGSIVTIGDEDLKITYIGGDGNDVVLLSAQPPTDITLDGSSIAENAPIGTEVGTFSTVDPDADDTFTYTLVLGEGDDDNDLFTIDTNGNLLLEAVFDYEMQTSYSIRVRSTDSAGFWIEEEFTITITPLNDNSPVFTSSSTFEVAENTTSVGTVQATDSDQPPQTIGYSITGGADQELFIIDSETGLLNFKQAPDYEVPESSDGSNDYVVIVTASDGAGGTNTQTITVTVTPVHDNAPVFTSPTSYEVSENSALVGTVKATDADKRPQAVTYAIVLGGDAALFTIDPATGVLSFIVAPNYESPSDANGDNVYSLTVSASDGAGDPVTQNIEVTVTPVNEFAPFFTSSTTYIVAENVTTVGTVHATDDDLPPQTVTYSITGGTDSSKFQIDPETGALTFITAPDYENPTDDGDDNVYNVEVTASDNDGKTTIQAISVTVTPVNDNSPFFTSPGAFSVAENTTPVGTVVATDADKPPQTVTYSITGGLDADKFSIDSTTGALTFKNAPDYESPTDNGGDNVYNVIVTANDGSGLTTPQSITITVTPVNDNAPVFAGSSPFTVAEGVTTVGTIAATDADEPDATITYSISGGIDAALFYIEPTTGVLSFLTAPDYEHPADAGANNSYEVQVSANDGTHTTAEDLTVNVTNTVEEPTITLNPVTGTYYLGKTDAFVDPIAEYQADVTETDYSQATLTVSITVNRQSKDQLAISGQGDKPGQINVKGKKIYFGGLEIGTFKGGKKSNPNLVITFNSAASEAAVQALVKRITFYVKNGKMPQPTRTVQMQLTNVSEHNSNAATRQIEVLELN